MQGSQTSSKFSDMLVRQKFMNDYYSINTYKKHWLKKNVAKIPRSVLNLTIEIFFIFILSAENNSIKAHAPK
jgi:hypothetical protein